jgi:diguanylate cyclase (GGDEF)-like protein
MKKQTVLIVDDLRTNALALAGILEPEWHTQTAFDGPSALQMAAAKPPPDLILLDIKMPGMDGYEVCRRLKESPETDDIPVIFITAANREENEAYGLSLGAVDYIAKPVNPPIIRARIRNHIALRTALSELQNLAAHDPLTALYNRRKLDESFEFEVARAERYGRPLSVILLDIDHFKVINDAHGHQAGDAVLAGTGRWLRAALRTSDIPGRWGGEEFLVICPETVSGTASQLAERLRQDYAAQTFFKDTPLTASFGVASHCKGRTAENILFHADEALYRAKNGGRNRVEQEAP